MSFIENITEAINKTSATEWLIFVTALLYVVLATKENVWCWSMGILSSGFSIYLCFQGNLFLESFLQLFYVVIGFYGWYQWLHGSDKKEELKITSWNFKKNIPLFFIGILVFIPLGFIAHKYSTQALPYLDAFITSFSLIATWMTATKIIENWIYWIIIDFMALILYFSRDFYLIAILYLLYTLLAFLGYIKWKKTFQTSNV